MDLNEALYTRRSVRKYQDKTVPIERIEEAVKAAMFAPSARNQQPWEFIIINKKELLNEIPTFSPHAAMVKNASAGVLICFNKDYETAEGFFPQDLGAAHAKSFAFPSRLRNRCRLDGRLPARRTNGRIY